MASSSPLTTGDFTSSPGSREPSPDSSPRLSEINVKGLEEFSHLCVLLRALNETYKKTSLPEYLSLSGNSDNSLTLFEQFLDKLAQICDCEKGGSTVTAMTCLKGVGGPEFLFGSNARKTAELDRTKIFLSDLIGYLAESPVVLTTKQLRPRQKQVLWRILKFNKPRIEIYLKSLNHAIKEGIQSCLNDGNAENSDFLENLRGLQEKANFPYGNETSDGATNKFLSDCETLLKAIWQLKNSAPVFHSNLDTYADRKDSNARNWSQLRHLLGRLLSYRQAADVFIKFSNTPENFEMLKNSKFSYIASAKPKRVPISRIVTAKELARVGFPDYDASEIEAEMNRLDGFDENVRKEVKNRNNATLVHSEVGLHHDLIMKGKVLPSDFWESSLYIATSKPPCRLCHFYFNAPDNDFQVQPSSKNIYLKWRLPDLLENCDAKVLELHEDVMEAINDQLQEDILDIIQNKRPTGKDHDSWTNPPGNRSAEQSGLATTSNDTQSQDAPTRLDEGGVAVGREMRPPQKLADGLSDLAKVRSSRNEYGRKVQPAIASSQPPSTAGSWSYIDAARG